MSDEKEKKKGRSFENALADPDKYDLPALRRQSKAFQSDMDSWLRKCNPSNAEKMRKRKELVDAEIERRASNEI